MTDIFNQHIFSKGIFNKTVFGSVGGVTPFINLTSPSPQTLTSVAGKTFDQGFTLSININHTGKPDSQEYLFQLRANNSNYVSVEFSTTGDGFLVPKALSAGTDQLLLSDDFPIGDFMLTQGQTSITLAGDDTQIALYINGIKAAYLDSPTLPAGDIVNLGIGQAHNASAATVLADTINSFEYFDQKLSDAQIWNLTRITDYGLSPAPSYDNDLLILTASGQSNINGNVPGTPSMDYPNASDIFLIEKDGDKIAYSDATNDTAIYNQLESNQKFSYGGVACDMIAQQTGKNVAWARMAKPNTGLLSGGNDQWGPYVAVGSVQVMKALTFAAINMERIASLHGQLYMRVWHQGESDAINNVTQANYSAALVAFLNTMNTYHSMETIVVGLHDNPPADYSAWAGIQAAQAAINSSVPSAYPLSAQGVDVISGNELHISVSGHIDFGHDLGNEILTRKGKISSDIAFNPHYAPDIETLVYEAVEADGTYSGGDMTAFTPLVGGDIGVTQFFDGPQWDGALFGGAGGLKVTSTTDQIQSAAFTAGAVHTVITSWHFPAGSGNLFIQSFARNTDARFGLTTNGLIYRDNEANTAEIITSGVVDQYDADHMHTLRYNSAGDLDIFVDGTEIDSFDPHDAYATQTVINLMSYSSDGLVGLGLRNILHSTHAIQDGLLAKIHDVMAGDASIAL